MKKFLLSLILAGCSSSTIIEPSFNKHIEFYQVSLVKNGCREIKLDNYTIYFTNLGFDTLGQCTRYFWYRKIEINYKTWHFLNEVEKIMLIAHELEHCHFGANHVKDKNNYMYDFLPTLELDVFIKQLNESLKKRCVK